MRPIKNVPTGVALAEHRHAKPDLIAAMGEYCAYCERRVDPTDLHVEHIKPQNSHPKLKLVWQNYLLACKRCNTYKRHYQQKNRQTGNLGNQIWPHLDNTFSAYTYDQDGRVSVATTLTTNEHKPMAERTLEMAGLSKTPAVAASYKKLGIDYDTISQRKKAWCNAQAMLQMYKKNPTTDMRVTIANFAEAIGFFSIWMATFAAYPKIKCTLITRFKAAAQCFDDQGNSLNPRHPGRV